MAQYDMQAGCVQPGVFLYFKSLIRRQDEDGWTQQSLGTRRQYFTYSQHTLSSYLGSGYLDLHYSIEGMNLYLGVLEDLVVSDWEESIKDSGNWEIAGAGELAWRQETWTHPRTKSKSPLVRSRVRNQLPRLPTSCQHSSQIQGLGVSFLLFFLLWDLLPKAL
jgi:hypothetical protein